MTTLLARTNRRILIIDDAPSIHADFRKILAPAIDDELALADAEEALFGTQPVERQRVALMARQRVPVREPAELRNLDGQTIGQVTSGLLSPMLDKPIAMGYVQPDYAALGTELFAIVRCLVMVIVNVLMSLRVVAGSMPASRNAAAMRW